jgi:IS30 family transposase
MSSYTQLTQAERYQIYVLRKAGHSPTEIAGMLGRCKSTVSRELTRNRGRRGYRPGQAQRLATARRKARDRRRIPAWVWQKIEALIRRDWSPEQIAGRLRLEGGIAVSHEWIYRRVYTDKRSGGDLHTHLRCRKMRRKRYGTYDRRGRISGRISIDERPAIVESRRRIGDWEGDTVIGRAHLGALVTLVERKSAYTLIDRVDRKTAACVREAVVGRLAPHKERVHTITYDNGREFSEHARMAADLEAAVYFAHPYCSWERGVNENTNGLIRQYFPKHRDLTTVTGDELHHAMHRLNHRPRKNLEYQTPHEVFFQTRTLLTVALQS